MEVSFHPSLAGAPPATWPESGRIAVEVGLTCLDIDSDALDSHPPEEVRAQLNAAGIRAAACPLPVEMREDEDTFVEDLSSFGARAERAAKIGVRTMHRSIPAASDREPDEFVPVLRRRWRACAQIAGEHGIGLAIEPLGPLYRRRAGAHEIVWRLSDAIEFVDSCGPGVGLLVDSWHWHLAGSTPEEIVAAGERILHVHLADVPDASAESLRDTERALPGEGLVDFEAFLGAVETAGYSGPASPEVPGRWSSGMGRVDSARRALEATLSVLEGR